MKTKIVNLFKTLLLWFNKCYGPISLLVSLFLLGYIKNTLLIILVLGIGIFDMITWWKNYIKHLDEKNKLIGTIKENNVCQIVGGVGSGKSTLAHWAIKQLTKNDLRYSNTNTKGWKAFTNRHLFLLDALEEGSGVIVDEAGRQVDSFHYDKKDNDVRARIVTYNKFFRQFYGSNSYCFYIDQSVDNENTALYRSIYYFIQCKSCTQKPTEILLYTLFNVFKLLFRKKKLNNPFTYVSIEVMEFVKTGDYADHYSINIDDKSHKLIVCPIQAFFGIHNTYVFRNFNPAEKVKPYIWGTNEKMDAYYMEQNFALQELKKKFDSRDFKIGE